MRNEEGRFGGPLSCRLAALAYIVASPRLLDTECQTVEQMKLVNALCRFVEFADA
jgi:hypothetical protein